MESDPTRRFRTTALGRPGGGITIELPFDAAEAWGDQARHDVVGTIGGYGMRGQLTPPDAPRSAWRLHLGPSWCRDPRVGAGREVEVELSPEPPRLATVADDIRAAIAADPAARRQFGAIATFYRKGFIDWIESAKRAQTREARIAATVEALRAGRRER